MEELRKVLTENTEYACEHIWQNYPGVRVNRPEGTLYAVFWILSEWCETNGQTLDEVMKAGWDVGVAWQDGKMFFGPWSIRMNLALPLSRVKEAFERLRRYVFQG